MKINDFNFAGHKAIVRVDFNVPLDEHGHVTDDTRIRGALPTLKKVLEDGGALIMMSHMGKPKGKVKPELSLSQIVKNVSDALGVDVKFAKDAGNADAEAAALKPGEALLLENLRYYPEEEGKPVGVEKGTPEYDAAKEAQAHLEDKINKLKVAINEAKIVDTSRLSADTVQILSKVEMTNLENKAKMTYTIVSESEANLKEGKIAITTPIAQGLLNKRVGDEVEIKIPRGTIKLRIDNISIE